MNTADWQAEYPFATGKIDLDGQKYHFVDEGAGRPLLFVHGNPTWSFYWRHLISAFSDKYRAVAVDHIGCGLSDKPQNYNYSLAQHIENLRRLVVHLDLRDITLLVHDWGGAIGLGALLSEAKRFSSIVLFNTGAFPPPYIPLRIRACRFPWLGNWAMRQLNVFARAALFMAVAKRRSLSPAAKAGLLAPYDSYANRVAIARFVQDISASPRHPTWQVLQNIEQGLKKLPPLPVQIIWGMQDWCFNEVCLKRFENIFPQAEVHRLASAGHYVVEEARKEIEPLVRAFLK